MPLAARAAAVEAAARLLGGWARRDEPIGGRTTYRVGGRAALFVELGEPGVADALCEAVAETGVDVLVLGRGSNLLVAERGFAGVCVALGPPHDALRVEAASASLEAGGAVPLPVVARRAAAAGLTGMEWAVGIPGSVGGAVRMNAGSHGCETADRLVSARVLDLRDGVGRDLPAAALALGYRRSAIGRYEVVCSARFALERAEASRAQALVAQLVRWRREHQPGGRNGGSVFANPPGESAGRLIEAAGLKGRRRNGARVSTKHANFIVVEPGGTADDVYALACEVREVVAARLGVELAWELETVGFAP
ncbi:MAG TPA: UDP-N-acetylmuramate dehydrogenase [Acidimicrobiales bacterium]|nr:UDP-N-acetylmuramate dehydrogenase [Acidimicrobiales bacterium]